MLRARALNEQAKRFVLVTSCFERPAGDIFRNWFDEFRLQLAFLCTFSGMLAALAIWAGLYTLASECDIPMLAAMAPYLEALSLSGQVFFLVLAAVLSWLTYTILRRRGS